MTATDALDPLAASYGIAGDYYDIWGHRHTVSAATKRALLVAMGVDAASDDDAAQALAEHQSRRWRRWLEPVQVAPSGAAIAIALNLPEAHADTRFAWRIWEEDGAHYNGELRPQALASSARQRVDGADYRRYHFPLPRTPAIGYHRFELQALDGAAAAHASMSLIIAPTHCYQPPALAAGRRLWGITLQLYALRSRRNWGIGDFSDLEAAFAVCAQLGAAVIGVNPLHALFLHHPSHISPYSPSSRLFLNPLYVDVEAIADFAECEHARAIVADADFQAQLRMLRASELVDYPAVARLKLRILELLFRHFSEHHLHDDSSRGKSFRAFQYGHGEALRRYALFDALQEHFLRQNPALWGWPVWPVAYRHPDSPEVIAFAAAHQTRLEFHEYLQWQAAEQLAAASAEATARGLAIGLYRDLAVGVDGGAGEVWADPESYAQGVRIGAPPDDFSPNGQDWGLPPLTPETLRASAYHAFIQTLRANMAHTGALRIDHVMALRRLYWVPAGATARDGAYVDYPFADLLAIVALESHRNRCLVIGEDLGTVPDDIRQALAAAEVLSYRLFYFEKNWQEGSFKAPEDYPRHALVAVSTHDLPTWAGFWNARDIEWRSDLGLFPSQPFRETQLANRTQDRDQILRALQRAGLASSGPAPLSAEQLMIAVHDYLSRSPAQLMVAQIEDILGQIEQVNLPGTIDQHPNWRRKLLVNVEDWLALPQLRALAGALNQERGAHAMDAHA